MYGRRQYLFPYQIAGINKKFGKMAEELARLEHFSILENL